MGDLTPAAQQDFNMTDAGIAMETAEGGDGTPQVTWRTAEGAVVAVPEWLARLTSGRCSACNTGSLH